MALAEYTYEGRTFLFEDNDVPDGAVRTPKHVAEQPPAKADTAPANKARRAANK